jgi:hypothetical protein
MMRLENSPVQHQAGHHERFVKCDRKQSSALPLSATIDRRSAIADQDEENSMLTFRSALVGAGVALTTAVTQFVAADTTMVTASRDATIYNDVDFKANGAGVYLFAGQNALETTRRGLVYFDIAGNVPAGSTITSVAVMMNLTQTIAGTKEIGLHRILADWGTGLSDPPGGEGNGAFALENDCTWAYRFYSETTPELSPMWASPGGDFSPVASVSTLVGSDFGTYTWVSTAASVTDVQDWLDTPASNFGWMVINTDEVTPSTAKRFNSSENSSAATRPRIMITFDPPSATPCPADCAPKGGNDVVNIDDLLSVINDFGNAGGPCDNAPDNGDGTFGNDLINIDDVLGVINAFGPCP